MKRIVPFNPMMKNTLMKKVLVLFVSVLVISSCDTRSISEILYADYNGKDGFSILVLPPNFVDKFISPDQANEKELLRSIDDFRLMFFDRTIDVEGGITSVKDHIYKLLDDRNFEEYIAIIKDGSNILLKGIEKNDLISEMHLMIAGEEQLILASFKGRINLNQAMETINQMDLEDMENLEGLSGDFDMDNFKWSF